MTVTIEGIGTLEFWFKHMPHATHVYCEFSGRTHMAAASLAHGDTYNKATGRRVALGRLLKRGLLHLVPCEATKENLHFTAKWATDLTFTRPMRAQIWKAYFAAHADLRKQSLVQGPNRPTTKSLVVAK